MLEAQTARSVIDHALFSGADFAELFIEKHHSGNVELLTGDVDKVQSGIDFGIGVRLFFGHKVLYGHTNSKDEEQLKRVVSALCAQDLRDQLILPVSFMRPVNRNSHPALEGFSADSRVEEKIAFLRKIDERARNHSNKITQVISRYYNANKTSKSSTRRDWKHLIPGITPALMQLSLLQTAMSKATGLSLRERFVVGNFTIKSIRMHWLIPCAHKL